METPPTIFHVEDCAKIPEVVQDYITKSGREWKYQHMDCPETALKQIEQASPSCLVTDYKMPKLNGDQVFTEARSKKPSLPVIFFTSERKDKIPISFSSDRVSYVGKVNIQENSFAALLSTIDGFVSASQNNRKIST